jgi:predicted O-methyltransferase YrrM
MSVAILATAVIILLVCLYTLHKVRNIHLLLYSTRDQMQAEIRDSYQQLEHMRALHVDLGLTKSLPGTRGWAASPDFLAELVGYALGEKPATVVECSSGTSTVVLARCMQINGSGKVYSLEHDPVYAAKTRAQLARHGLGAFAEVIDAPLSQMTFKGEPWKWYAHVGLPQALYIDMLVIDGPPDSSGRLARYPAGPALFPKLAQGAVVFLDDANRDSETEILQRWKSDFPELSQTMAYCEKGCAVLKKQVPGYVA